MRRNFKNYLIKVFSFVLAFILVFPTELFAMATSDTKSNEYNESSSLMGLAENQESEKVEDSIANQNLLKSDTTINENDDYIIEKYASLSKTTGQIDYKIVFRNKNKNNDQKQIASFALAKSTDLKDLKIEKVTQVDQEEKETEIKYEEQRPGMLYANESYETLGITTAKAESTMVYYLSAKLTEEALKNIEEVSHQMALDINIADEGLSVYQNRYSLELVKAENTNTLVEVEENAHLTKGIYTKENPTILGEKPAEILWTDYINPTDGKEFTYDIRLDDSQETSKTEIKIEFYQASEKGYILKEEYTKNIPFSKSLNLQIPQGYIAKLEIKTQIKENQNPKKFTFNQTNIANPTYTEEKNKPTEEQTSDDTDPLPADTSKEENSQSQKADETQTSKESNKESTVSTLSAIALNKDAYISGLKENNKLTTNLENATKQIALSLESYNKEDITWDDFVGSVQNIAKAQNIDQAQTEDILSGLTAGLNENKYKVANIDIKEAAGVGAKTSNDNEESSEPTVEEGADSSRNPSESNNIYESKVVLDKGEFTQTYETHISRDEGNNIRYSYVPNKPIMNSYELAYRDVNNNDPDLSYYVLLEAKPGDGSFINNSTIDIGLMDGKKIRDLDIYSIPLDSLDNLRKSFVDGNVKVYLGSNYGPEDYKYGMDTSNVRVTLSSSGLNNSAYLIKVRAKDATDGQTFNFNYRWTSGDFSIDNYNNPYTISLNSPTIIKDNSINSNNSIRANIYPLGIDSNKYSAFEIRDTSHGYSPLGFCIDARTHPPDSDAVYAGERLVINDLNDFEEFVKSSPNNIGRNTTVLTGNLRKVYEDLSIIYYLAESGQLFSNGSKKPKSNIESMAMQSLIYRALDGRIGKLSAPNYLSNDSTEKNYNESWWLRGNMWGASNMPSRAQVTSKANQFDQKVLN